MRLADLDHSMQDSVLFAKLHGEIDISNAGELRDELTRVTPNEALALILDLTGVEYLDSAGIHMVYRLREDLNTRGLEFRLVVPEDSPVNDALRLAGIERGTAILANVEAARQSLPATKPTSPQL